MDFGRSKDHFLRLFDCVERTVVEVSGFVRPGFVPAATETCGDSFAILTREPIAFRGQFQFPNGREVR